MPAATTGATTGTDRGAADAGAPTPAVAREVPPAATTEVTVVAREHPTYPALTWRVLDVAAAANSSQRASWHRPPHPAATGRAFIAVHRLSSVAPRTGRRIESKRVRVVDRHPADDWADLGEAALLAQLARAYLPRGWVERHGGTGVGWRWDRGAGGASFGRPTVAGAPHWTVTGR